MSTTTLVALFLLSAFTLYPSSTTAAEPVYDIEGKPIQNGGSYYLLPTIWSSGGGIGLAKTGNETCPLSVVQSPSKLSNGLPVKISSPFTSLFVPQGRVSLSFAAVPTCATTPSKWTVVKGLPEGPVVKLSGYENTIDGVFYIHKASNILTYKLLFCIIDNTVCGFVGIVKDDDDNLLLAVTRDNGFQFGLVKATSSTE